MSYGLPIIKQIIVSTSQLLQTFRQILTFFIIRRDELQKVYATVAEKLHINNEMRPRAPIIGR